MPSSGTGAFTAAAQGPVLVLHQLGAGFEALGIEHRADCIAFEFGVGVVGIADPQLEPFKRAFAQGDVALEVGAELVEADFMGTVFPHPTLSEMMHESVLSAYGQALHF